MFNNNYMNRFFTNKNITFNNRTLDKYQTKAVLCSKDNYLIIAGAGSGKTLTIAAKIKYLLDNNIKEREILCISFTNETVNSLKTTLNNNLIDVDVMTFHKLALGILNNSFNIASPDLLEYTTNEFFESFIYHDNTYKILNYMSNKNNLRQLINTFIMHMKALDLKEDYLYELINDKNIYIDDKLHLVLILKVYLIYKEELNSELKIDFDDMINLAYEKVKYLDYFPYKYVIIDEYQDTSVSKYRLIKALVDKFGIKLTAVGDDYQSIYAFTGCKLSLFTKYKKYFKGSKIIKLKCTYRNSNDIVQISKRFVMKNKNQINKRLKTNKYIDDSITVIYSKTDKEALLYLLKDLDNILILGRNNKDIEGIIDEELGSITKDKNIRLLTVHKSKGLEEDNIIILNVIDDTLGFPNKINDNKILKYIKDEDNLESERRLFYVALTRAKKRVFIITKKNKESIFIKELIKEFKYKIKIVSLD